MTIKAVDVDLRLIVPITIFFTLVSLVIPSHAGDFFFSIWIRRLDSWTIFHIQSIIQSHKRVQSAVSPSSIQTHISIWYLIPPIWIDCRLISQTNGPCNSCCISRLPHLNSLINSNNRFTNFKCVIHKASKLPSSSVVIRISSHPLASFHHRVWLWYQLMQQPAIGLIPNTPENNKLCGITLLTQITNTIKHP